MARSRPAVPLLLLAAAFLFTGGPAAAQLSEDDPRFAEDPRDSADPRNVPDPREAEEARQADADLENLEGVELFEALWERGSTAALSDAMRENSWSLLGWIDSHCEKWLALVEARGLESAEDQARAAELVDKATQLAQLADAALKDTRFSTYVHTFTNWNAEQQAAFRGGQGEFKSAMRILDNATSPQAARAALTPLERSLAAARPLGDTWGQSMTLAAMGRVHHANQEWQAARDRMRDAVTAGRTIRDLDSVWEGLNVIFESSMAMGEFRAARETLQDQYQLSVEVGDEESEQRVLDRMLAMEEIIGRQALDRR